MIDSNTLFVLGAGASIPYGLPSGAKLLECLCELGSGGGPSALLDDLLYVSQREQGIFAEHLRRSKVTSIDSFLAKRPDLSKIGKKAIAATLCHFENEEALYSNGLEDDWFRELWKVMHDGVPANSPGMIQHNRVRFLTFNYDRSLECLLHNAVKSTFNIHDDQALAVWGSIPIAHVYGHLGEFHWCLGNDCRPYGSSVDSFDLGIAERNLKVIPEARDDDQVFMDGRDWFNWAKTVCFLGFGFDAINMSRLGFDSVFAHLTQLKVKPPRVVASGYGMTAAEIRRLQYKYKHLERCEILPMPNRAFIREVGIFD